MKPFKIGYLFPAAIFIYGLIGALRQKIWLHDPGSQGMFETGLSAILIGVGFMVLACIIFDIVKNFEKHYQTGSCENFNPFTLRVKILASTWILLWLIYLIHTIFP